jgi:chromate transporter
MGEEAPPPPLLTTILREWLRIGVIGFGGPPAHIALLRRLCVERRKWISGQEFEDAISAVNLLPGPASTQLAIFCAWRLRRTAGALIGGASFIAPGLLMILGLSALFLEKRPPIAVLGAAAGAGAAVPAVAVRAALDLVPSSWARRGTGFGAHLPWLAYAIAGAATAALAGEFVVIVLLACGLCEILRTRAARPGVARAAPGALGMAGLKPAALAAVAVVAAGGMLALAYVAFKVGALSYGGGFVIVPLMQHDAVDTFHWMTGSQFLGAVALGQITPGPVVLTTAVVGYAAGRVPGALLATLVAFTPSFLFVLLGARSFDRIRHNERVQTFLAGSGPAAIGAIAGAAITLGLEIGHEWQIGVLCAALTATLLVRGQVVVTLVGAALIGLVVGVLGGAVR